MNDDTHNWPERMAAIFAPLKAHTEALLADIERQQAEVAAFIRAPLPDMPDYGDE